jgi:hypothetical protein
MGVDPGRLAFIPLSLIFFNFFFFTFDPPGRNKIETARVIQDKGRER